jgi:hypothetical protein
MKIADDVLNLNDENELESKFGKSTIGQLLALIRVKKPFTRLESITNEDRPT